MSTFVQEVFSQPQDLKVLAKSYSDHGFAQIIQAQRLLNQAGTIVFSGMGTSYYAPFFVKDKLAGRAPVLIEAGDLYEYNMALLQRPNTVLVLISQSGESIEVCRILEEIPDGCQVIAITNDLKSTLAQGANCVLPLCASEEKTITNRTFTNTLGVLMLLCAAEDQLESTAKTLMEIAEEMEQFLEGPGLGEKIQKAARLLQPGTAIHFIGRGGDGLVCAYQAGLIFTEGAKCLGRGCSTGTFHHGPMEMCGPEHRAVVFAQADGYYGKTQELCKKMTAVGSRVVVIGSGFAEGENLVQIQVPNSSAGHFAFAAAVAFELLLVDMAQLRGYVAGDFATGSKVTRED